MFRFWQQFPSIRSGKLSMLAPGHTSTHLPPFLHGNHDMQLFLRGQRKKNVTLSYTATTGMQLFLRGQRKKNVTTQLKNPLKIRKSVRRRRRRRRRRVKEKEKEKEKKKIMRNRNRKRKRREVFDVSEYCSD